MLPIAALDVMLRKQPQRFLSHHNDTIRLQSKEYQRLK